MSTLTANVSFWHSLRDLLIQTIAEPWAGATRRDHPQRLYAGCGRMTTA
jgi:hypothetical protein